MLNAESVNAILQISLIDHCEEYERNPTEPTDKTGEQIEELIDFVQEDGRKGRAKRF